MTPQIIQNYREARLTKTSNCYSKRGMSFIEGICEVLGITVDAVGGSTVGRESHPSPFTNSHP